MPKTLTRTTYRVHHMVDDTYVVDAGWMRHRETIAPDYYDYVGRSLEVSSKSFAWACLKLLMAVAFWRTLDRLGCVTHLGRYTSGMMGRGELFR